jgi:hypothetical protein
MLGVAASIYAFEKTVGETAATRWWPVMLPLWLTIFGVLLVRGFPFQYRLACHGIVARGRITEHASVNLKLEPFQVCH